MPRRHVSSPLALVLAAASAFLASGCATIVHNGPRSLPVSSDPPGAMVSIYDRGGKQVYHQAAPFIATLPSKYKFFSGQSYRLVFEMPGYKKSEVQVVPKLSGWYWGNIAFGGLLGMLIIDPATGAMYNLAPNKVDHRLTPETAGRPQPGNDGLLVITTSQATASQLAAMERITPIG
jgi:hypothetical protein